MTPLRGFYNFDATCVRCFRAVPLTKAEEKARIGPGGEFVCDRCKRKPLRIRVEVGSSGR